MKTAADPARPYLFGVHAELRAIEQSDRTLAARRAYALGTLGMREYRTEKDYDGAVHQARGLELSTGLGGEAETVGRIEWSDETGEVLHLLVNPDHRRRGHATRLWRAAEALGARHSRWRTIDGQKWAASLGDPLPPWELA